MSIIGQLYPLLSPCLLIITLELSVTAAPFKNIAMLMKRLRSKVAENIIAFCSKVVCHFYFYFIGQSTNGSV